MACTARAPSSRGTSISLESAVFKENVFSTVDVITAMSVEKAGNGTAMAKQSATATERRKVGYGNGTTAMWNCTATATATDRSQPRHHLIWYESLAYVTDEVWRCSLVC